MPEPALELKRNEYDEVDLMNVLHGVEGYRVSIRAMLHGLWEAQENPDFQIDMSTFGAIEGPDYDKDKGEICYGCAATCALTKITGQSLTVPMHMYDYPMYGTVECLHRAKSYGLRESDTHMFEVAIDDFREGHIDTLLDFCRIRQEWDRTYLRQGVRWRILRSATSENYLEWRPHTGVPRRAGYSPIG